MNDTTPLTPAELEAYRMLRTGGDRSRLEWHGFKVYSQSDEDGILERIFTLIGAPHRRFVEFGCEGGTENNTRYLVEQGWRGLWIEGNPHFAAFTRQHFWNYIDPGQVAFREAYVTAETINDLILGAGLGGEIDLLSIDIDSVDYYVFDAIRVISPRVVVLEHNHTFAPGTEYIMPYDKTFRWDPASGKVPYGASISAMARLARSKGYTLVGCGLVSPNGFYVRNDLVGDRFTGPFDEHRLFNRNRPARAAVWSVSGGGVDGL